MKFIKLESFWKDPSAWLVNINDITHVVDKNDYREVTAVINGNAEKFRVKNTLDEIHTTIEAENFKNNEAEKDIKCNKPLYD